MTRSKGPQVRFKPGPLQRTQLHGAHTLLGELQNNLSLSGKKKSLLVDKNEVCTVAPLGYIAARFTAMFTSVY